MEKNNLYGDPLIFILFYDDPLFVLCCLFVGLQPKSAMAKKIATKCVLPLLLSGILGAFSNHERLLDYLRKLFLLNTTKEVSWSANCSPEVIDAVRFTW